MLETNKLYPKLQLICRPTWMRDEIAATGLNFKHSFGIEIPTFSEEDIWWMPQGYAVELNKALQSRNIKPIQLISPGPYLTTKVNQKYLHRQVQIFTVEQALKNPLEGWWKSAEAKIDGFPAQKRTKEETVKAIQENKLPLDSLLQYTKTSLPIIEEYRSFVKNGKVLTTSIYLKHGNFGDGITEQTVYDGATSNPVTIVKVKDFVENMLKETPHPPSIVVDTAVLASGELAILEFNPSWCSAWYECDLEKVVEVVAAGFHLSNNLNHQWAYIPDSYFVNKIARKPVLPFSPQFNLTE